MRLIVAYAVCAAGVLAAIRCDSAPLGLLALVCGVVAMGLMMLGEKR